MSNDTDNPSKSPDGDTLKNPEKLKAALEKDAEDALKESEKLQEDFEKAVEISHKGNEDLKNRMFIGCFGLAAIMISAAAVVSGKPQLGGMAWGIYAAQTVMVVLFVFGLQALAVAISLIASSNPEQPLWRWITGKKKYEPDSYTSYDFLARVADYMDMSCLVILAGWNISMAVRIAVTLLCL